MREIFSLSFIWARVKKRSKNLGMYGEDSRSFVNHLARVDVERGVELMTETACAGLTRKGKTIEVSCPGGRTISADAVISTLPTPVLLKGGEGGLASGTRMKAGLPV
jgi:predicted flavoprotein YhiN